MLETSKVFIDTEYFRSKEFNFENTTFKKFQTLCEDETFDLLITSVVKQEVERQIKTKVSDFQSIIKNFSRKKHIFSMMSTLDITDILALEADDTVMETAMSKFINYLDNCYYELITPDRVEIEQLLSLYFNQQAPFSNGKKNEFPDAISLLSLESHIENNSVYVVSGDNDLKKYCENRDNLIHIQSLDNLLDIYNKDLDVLSKEITKYIFENSSEIEDKITQNIEKCEAYNFSTWEDAELEYFSVTEIEEIEPNIIDINENYALVNFDINVHFEVSVRGFDYNSAHYDKEDEKYYFIEKTTINDYVMKSLNIEMELVFLDGIKSININSIDVNCKTGLKFEVDQS